MVAAGYARSVGLIYKVIYIEGATSCINAARTSSNKGVVGHHVIVLILFDIHEHPCADIGLTIAIAGLSDVKERARGHAEIV